MSKVRNRSDLGFSEAVLRAFEFLVRDFGFRCAEASPTLVRYESRSVVVALYHGRQSFEVGFEINTRAAEAKGDPAFELPDILEAAGQGEALPLGFLQGSTPDAVNFAVGRVAALLRDAGSEALKGDPFCSGD